MIIEPLLDDGSIAIVPNTDDKGEEELRIRVLERNKRWMDDPSPFNNLCRRDLQDRRLVFKGPNRPKKRYLYFMYLIALHKCVENDRTEGRRAEMARSRKVFASLIPSLRASMVPAFAAQLGQDIAPLMPEHEAAAEEELDKTDPESLLLKFKQGLKEMDREEDLY